MHKILEKTLVKKYPDIMKDYGGDITKTCMGWGFSCGKGWFLLLNELCGKLKGLNVTARQVKEKFGTLRFYADGDEGSHEIISEYEDKSGTTCEDCGGLGDSENRGGWLKTICPGCREKRDLASKIRSGDYAYCFDEPGHIIICDPLDLEDPNSKIFSGTFDEFMQLMAPDLRLLEDPMSTIDKPLWEQIEKD
jgi:hypothetical protein